MATPQPTTTDVATPPTARNNILAPQVTSDMSLLEPSPASLKPQVREPQGSLALTLFENPLGSIRVPSEYTSYPVAHEWDNKVRFVNMQYKIACSDHSFQRLIVSECSLKFIPTVYLCSRSCVTMPISG